MISKHFRNKFLLLSIASLVFGAVVGLFFAALINDLPPVESLEFYKPDIVTYVYDADNTVISEWFTERRVILKRNEIPDKMVHAILSAEDADFYKHTGIDFSGILRAALIDIKSFRVAQGASTITQQLARLLFLTNERTFTRKLKEAILAVEIERHYSKDEILTLYMNQCYFGHGAYGVESAAQTFFDTSVSELTIPQCALLVSLLTNPYYNSPFRFPDKALHNRNKVLRRMYRNGYISAGELKTYLNSPLSVKKGRFKYNVGPYFIEYVRKQTARRIGDSALLKKGLKIYTTLNSREQKAAELAVHKGLEAYRARSENGDKIQGALVAIRPETGDIVAMVGGDDFSQSGFNRAVMAKRQCGSAIKPFVYLTAFQNGFRPNSILNDSPVVFEDPQTHKKWRPKNYDRKYHGPITLRVGLEHSYNVITARLIEHLDISRIIETAHKAGINSSLPPYPSVVLGSGEVSLLELTNAYATLAAYGIRATPRAIRRIEDRNGNVICEVKPDAHEVLDARYCFQITHLLTGAVQSGTAWRARRIGRPVAAKTGTTNDSRNAWFMGYTPSLAAGVWVGFDLPRSLGRHETGSRTAGPIFTDFMEQALTGTAPEDFTPPRGLVAAKICKTTGMLAGPDCPDVVDEYFINGTEPTTVCKLHAQQDSEPRDTITLIPPSLSEDPLH